MTTYKKEYLEKHKSIGGKSKDATEINLSAMKNKLHEEFGDIFDTETLRYKNIQSPLTIYCKKCERTITTKIAKIRYYKGCELCAAKKRDVKKTISKIITNIKNRQLPQDITNPEKRQEKEQAIYTIFFNGFISITKKHSVELQEMYVTNILDQMTTIFERRFIEDITVSFEAYLTENKKLLDEKNIVATKI
jgi:hypothetical protein